MQINMFGFTAEEIDWHQRTPTLKELTLVPTQMWFCAGVLIAHPRAFEEQSNPDFLKVPRLGGAILFIPPGWDFHPSGPLPQFYKVITSGDWREIAINVCERQFDTAQFYWRLTSSLLRNLYEFSLGKREGMRSVEKLLEKSRDPENHLATCLACARMLPYALGSEVMAALAALPSLTNRQ